jgi:beta-glucosidase
MSQLPDMMDYNIRNGRTYMYFNGKPLYAFGYGLSYTTFRYSRLSTSSEVLSSDSNGEIVVSVDVKNTGPMAGDEVVQLYVKHMNSQVERPRMELKGFKRLYIPPGKTKNIAIPLRAKDLAFWDIESKRFVVEKNKIQLMVGASSNDIRLKKKIKVVD